MKTLVSKPRSDFSKFIALNKQKQQLVVQPRMGFGPIKQMADGLAQVRAVNAACVGTLTIDAYTRVGDFVTPAECLLSQKPINGFPIVSHSKDAIMQMLQQVTGPDFPIQVRHGTAEPQHIFRRMAELGLDTTEGGPVSYCLPYSRLPLSQAVKAWDESCTILANETEYPHIETFGGCMLGQLCPPSMLIAISILECMYFRDLGIPSVSASFAQGTSTEQDIAALKVLRDIASQRLGKMDWHTTLYTYMGIYPSSETGALRLLADSAKLAKQTGCERMIVKTKVESIQIPTIEENLEALNLAHRSSEEAELKTIMSQLEQSYYDEIFAQSSALIDATLNLHKDIGQALCLAFEKGILDIPYCLHLDNQGKTRSYIDSDNALRWASIGDLPISAESCSNIIGHRAITSNMLLEMLHHKANSYDNPTQ